MMFSELRQIQSVLTTFQDAKAVFDEFASKNVHISNGDTKKAIDVAKGLLLQANDHRVVIEMALESLKDGKLTPEEKARLDEAAKIHTVELQKFLGDAKALVGAEFEVLFDLMNKKVE